MNSRERVQRAINFDGPDRPPISHAILPIAQLTYGDELVKILRDVHEDFGWDFLTDLKKENFPPLYKAGEHYDDFGTLWSGTEWGICGIPKECPFENWDNYKNYTWPEFEVHAPGARLYSGHMVGPSDEYYSRGGWIVYFEQAQQLRGYNNLMMDLGTGSEEGHTLLGDLLDFNLTYIDKWLAHPYDGLHFADDWGTQRDLMISPDMWRKYFRPGYKKMFEKVIDAGVDVHFHSDGNIVDIIPDLLDMGVKVINCQANIIGLEKMKREFNGKVCFRTDMDRQKVMVFGSPADVKKHIYEVFTHLGSEKGGIIACGEIGEDVSLDNIKMMYETFMNFKF
jgi:uroporphyrinogen decarboxylase